MVKLRCMGKTFQVLVSSAIILLSNVAIRQHRICFGKLHSSLASDFNLTAMIEVDYSLTDWFRNEQGHRFAEKRPSFLGKSLIEGQTIYSPLIPLSGH